MKQKPRSRKDTTGSWALRGRPGAAPGTIETNPDAPKPFIRAMGFSENDFAEAVIETPEEISEWRTKWPMLWVNVDGLGDVEILTRVANVFELHPLSLEDVVHVVQRPKVEQFPHYLYIVVRMLEMEDDQLSTDQVSLFLGEGWVLTFQEREGDCLDPVRERLRRGKGMIRKRGASYFAYALVDAVVDHYFPVLESIAERLEALEDEVIIENRTDVMPRIHEARRDLITLRRAAWPLRETLSALIREHSDFIEQETRLFFRDTYDHSVQAIELVENYREICSALMDVYLSTVNNRMSEVMKVLTVLSAIFIPLTFIAGVYGMNFDPHVSPYNMPELEWYWGYPFSIFLMIVVALVQLYFFRRKGWIGNPDKGEPKRRFRRRAREY